MAGLYFMGEFMKEKDIEVLSELEDENFYGGLDYSINKGKIDTLDSLLKEEWSNQVFRNAIANNLSVVLKQLADKMEEAKATIKITEQMQEKRHKLINASIAEVKNIMSKEIIVTVNTASNDTTTSTDTFTLDIPAYPESGKTTNSAFCAYSTDFSCNLHP